MPLDGDARPSWVLAEWGDADDLLLTIRRVAYELSAALSLVDAAKGFPDFGRPGHREAYKRTLRTGTCFRPAATT